MLLGETQMDKELLGSRRNSIEFFGESEQKRDSMEQFG